MKIQNLTDLRRAHSAGNSIEHRSLVEDKLNGGKISRGRISMLSDYPEATALTISGLYQDSFEFLVKEFGSQLEHIHFWKCPRIEDFSPLEDLPQLKHVAFFWNQKATRLWDFRKTPGVCGLYFTDLNKLTDLDDLASATSLEELEFGGEIWVKTGIRTLDPLGALRSLKILSFSAKHVEDGRIEPLAGLAQLSSLEFSAKLFEAEQLAWLRARFPDTVQSSALAPYRALSQGFSRNGKQIDTLVMGKKGPFLDSVQDERRLKKYCDRFAAMLEFFTKDAAALPGSYGT